jgi:hypothetical protein
VVSRSQNASGCDAEGETLEDYCINNQNSDHPPAAVADLYQNAMQGAIHRLKPMRVAVEIQYGRRFGKTFGASVSYVTHYCVEILRSWSP